MIYSPTEIPAKMTFARSRISKVLFTPFCHLKSINRIDSAPQPLFPSGFHLEFVPFRCSLMARRLLQSRHSVNFADHPARISNRYTIGRNIFRHYTSGPYNTAFTNRHPGQYNNPGPYPATVFYRNRQSVGTTKISAASRCPFRIEAVAQLNGMCRRMDLHIRGNQDVIANRDFIAVDESTSHVNRDIIAYINIIAESANK